MEIRTDAWHYRFFSIGHDGCPPSRTNLCSYFWRTVLGLFMCTFLVAFAVFVASFAVWALYTHTSTSILVILVAATVVGGIVYREEHKRDRRDRREPGLVGAYVAARKSKMCPIINIIEIDDED